MFYKDNWLSWTYEDEVYGTKSTIDVEFKLTLTKTVNKPLLSYYDELFENARNIKDIISGPLDLLFSGGIDSEVILRVYRELKIPINVFIFKYEDMLNYREFEHAINVCTNLNVKHTVIDFNVEKFFENDAYDIWKKCNANSSGWLPHMKMTEYLDNTPVFGSGDPYWRRQDDGTWMFEIDEGAKFWTLYHKAIGRTAVTDWYEYRPEIILSHMQLPRIQQLINDQQFGKTSSFSNKSPVHKDYWGDIDIRPKMVGFERDKVIAKDSKPEFMLEFERQYTSKVRATTYRYTAKQITELLCLP
jgi:Queuosine biosynthesis protein QueC